MGNSKSGITPSLPKNYNSDTEPTPKPDVDQVKGDFFDVKNDHSTPAGPDNKNLPERKASKDEFGNPFLNFIAWIAHQNIPLISRFLNWILSNFRQLPTEPDTQNIAQNSESSENIPPKIENLNPIQVNREESNPKGNNPKKETQNIGLKWDNLVILANLNKRMSRRNERRFKNSESCLKFATEVLKAKLKKEPEDADIEKLKSGIEKLFSSNRSISNRVKIIYLDSIINEICSSPREISDMPHVAHIDRNGNICIRGTNRIKNLVFQGGGGKGMGYVEMLKVLTEHKQLKYLKKVVGSSAGALAATALAVGTEPDALLEFTQRIFEAQNIPDEEIIKYFDISDHTQFFGINLNEKRRFNLLNKSAVGIVKCVNEHIEKQILPLFHNIADDPETALNGLNENERERIIPLQDSYINHEKNGKKISLDHMITFKDLNILSRICENLRKANPHIENLTLPSIKDLTITVFNNTKEETIFCNAQNKPDIPIAVAARASISLPIVFEPIFYQFPGDADPSELRDGGLGSNTSAKVFINDDDSLKKQIQQQNTLTCIFDNKGTGHKAISTSSFQYGQSTKDRLISSVSTKLSGIHTNVTNNRAEENIILDNVANIMVVGHGNLSTTNLHPNEKQKYSADLMSEAWTKNWVAQYGGQDSYVELCDIWDQFSKILNKQNIQLTMNGQEIVDKQELIIREREKVKKEGQNINVPFFQDFASQIFKCTEQISDEDAKNIIEFLNKNNIALIEDENTPTPEVNTPEEVVRRAIVEMKQYIEDQMRIYAESLDDDELEAVTKNNTEDNYNNDINAKWKNICSSIYSLRHPQNDSGGSNP